MEAIGVMSEFYNKPKDTVSVLTKFTVSSSANLRDLGVRTYIVPLSLFGLGLGLLSKRFFN